MLIQPVSRDDAFLQDVAAARNRPGGFRLWWLGQSGYLVQWQNRHLLLDPYLSDSLTKKYAGTDKPHVRMTARVVDPARLDFIDVVTSSHNHTDHLDAETLRPLMQVNPALRLVIPAANREFVANRLGCDPGFPLGLRAGHSLEVAGFHFHAVPAAHETLETDDAGQHTHLGYVVRFGRWTIYHSGDTILYDGMIELLKLWSIDLAILPINGRAPERRVAGNLDGPQAAHLAQQIGARLVIPCHYEMFEFNTVSPRAFAAAAEELGQPYRLLQAGERWESKELP